MALKVLALEIAGEQVRAAVAERSWDSFRLLGTYENARAADEADLEPAVARLLAEAGKPDVVISGLPGELVAHRVLTLPFKDERKLRQVVGFALEEHLPFPIDEAVTTFTRIGQDAEGTLVFAAVARKSDLQGHLDLLGRAGLDPKIVTLGALALSKLLTRASEPVRNGHAPSAHLVLNIDQARTSLVLLDPSGAPRAMRTLSAGLETNGHASLSPRVAATIVSAARQTLLAHGADFEAPDLLIAGPAASIPGVRHEIAGGLASAVREGGDLNGLGVAEGFPGDWLRFGACIAMLLGEAPVNPIALLNFRRDDFTFHGRNFDVAPFYTSAMLAVGVLLLLGLHAVLSTAISIRHLNALDQQIRTIAAPALGAHTAPDTTAALRSGIATMRKQLDLMGGGSAHSTPLDVLSSLSAAMPPPLQVEFIDVEIDSTGLKIDGEADSFGTIDLVKKALASTPRFTDIEVDDAKVTGTTGKVDFHLSANVSEAGPQK
jgi:general secretion pathway protein L